MQARVHISGANVVQVLPFKGLGLVKCFMFLKGVSSAHQDCVYLIKNMAKSVKL